MNILSIGNVIERKRFDLCALACARLEKLQLDETVCWRILGEGPLLAAIQQMAPPAMEFLNRVDSLMEHYHWADVFVLPSYDEGFGLVYIEAIMCGCPIICRRGEGGTEIIEHTGGGILIEVPDSDEEAVGKITTAVKEIFNNRRTYMSESIIKSAQRKMDPVRIAAEWNELIGGHERSGKASA